MLLCNLSACKALTERRYIFLSRGGLVQLMAKALGVKPDAAAGHSLGEFSALGGREEEYFALRVRGESTWSSCNASAKAILSSNEAG